MFPKRAAKVKNKGVKPAEPVDSDLDLSEGINTAQATDQESSDEDEDEEPSSATARRAQPLMRSPSPNRRRSSRTAGQSEAPNYSMK